MKTKIIIILVVMFLVLPAFVFGDSLTLRLGYFVPQAKSDLWTDEFTNMDFSKSNFQNTIFGLSYERFLTKNISVVLGFDTYSKSKSGIYKDYVGYGFVEGVFAFPNDYLGDFYLGHSFSLSVTPIQLSLKLMPLGRQKGFIPYLGGGVGLFLWSVRMDGDLIDFSDTTWEYEDPDHGAIPIYPVYYVYADEDSRVSVGFQVFGGIMIPVGGRVTIEVELKYNFGRGELTKAFFGFEPFDLSGLQFSLGLSYWF